MISWPAAKQIRCVNPSIATVSPSRTRSATASRIVATFDVTFPCRVGGSAARLHVGHDLLEDAEGRPCLVLTEGKGRGHPDRRVTAAEQQHALLERATLHGRA